MSYTNDPDLQQVADAAANSVIETPDSTEITLAFVDPPPYEGIALDIYGRRYDTRVPAFLIYDGTYYIDRLGSAKKKAAIKLVTVASLQQKATDEGYTFPDTEIGEIPYWWEQRNQSPWYGVDPSEIPVPPPVEGDVTITFEDGIFKADGTDLPTDATGFAQYINAPEGADLLGLEAVDDGSGNMISGAQLNPTVYQNKHGYDARLGSGTGSYDATLQISDRQSVVPGDIVIATESANPKIVDGGNDDGYFLRTNAIWVVDRALTTNELLLPALSWDSRPATRIVTVDLVAEYDSLNKIDMRFSRGPDNYATLVDKLTRMPVAYGQQSNATSTDGYENFVAEGFNSVTASGYDRDNARTIEAALMFIMDDGATYLYDERFHIYQLVIRFAIDIALPLHEAGLFREPDGGHFQCFYGPLALLLKALGRENEIPTMVDQTGGSLRQFSYVVASDLEPHDDITLSALTRRRTLGDQSSAVGEQLIIPTNYNQGIAQGDWHQTRIPADGFAVREANMLMTRVTQSAQFPEVNGVSSMAVNVESKAGFAETDVVYFIPQAEIALGLIWWSLRGTVRMSNRTYSRDNQYADLRSECAQLRACDIMGVDLGTGFLADVVQFGINSALDNWPSTANDWPVQARLQALLTLDPTPNNVFVPTTDVTLAAPAFTKKDTTSDLANRDPIHTLPWGASPTSGSDYVYGAIMHSQFSGSNIDINFLRRTNGAGASALTEIAETVARPGSKPRQILIGTAESDGAETQIEINTDTRQAMYTAAGFQISNLDVDLALVASGNNNYFVLPNVVPDSTIIAFGTSYENGHTTVDWDGLYDVFEQSDPNYDVGDVVQSIAMGKTEVGGSVTIRAIGANQISAVAIPPAGSQPMTPVVVPIFGQSQTRDAQGGNSNPSEFPWMPPDNMVRVIRGQTSEAPTAPFDDYITAAGYQGSDAIRAATLTYWNTIGYQRPVFYVFEAIGGTSMLAFVNDGDSTRQWSDYQAKLDLLGTTANVAIIQWDTAHSTALTGDQEIDIWQNINDHGFTVNHTLAEALDPGYVLVKNMSTRHAVQANDASHSTEAVLRSNELGLPTGYPIGGFLTDGTGPHSDINSTANAALGVSWGMAIAAGMGHPNAPKKPYFSGATLDQTGLVLTATVELPNNGTLYSAAPSALSGFQVRELDGTGTVINTYSGDDITASVLNAAAGTVQIVRTLGAAWPEAHFLRIIKLQHGDLNSPFDAQKEQEIIDGELYETWAGDPLGRGVPVHGTVDEVGKWIVPYNTIPVVYQTQGGFTDAAEATLLDFQQEADPDATTANRARFMVDPWSGAPGVGTEYHIGLQFVSDYAGSDTFPNDVQYTSSGGNIDIPRDRRPNNTFGGKYRTMLNAAHTGTGDEINLRNFNESRQAMVQWCLYQLDPTITNTGMISSVSNVQVADTSAILEGVPAGSTILGFAMAYDRNVTAIEWFDLYEKANYTNLSFANTGEVVMSTASAKVDTTGKYAIGATGASMIVAVALPPV